MGLHIENVRRGMWVVVTGLVNRRREFSDAGVPEITFTGVPGLVVAVSPPFLAVRRRGRLQTLDTRVWEVSRVSRAYAAALGGGGTPRADNRGGRADAADPRACPRCGCRCRQLYTARTGWRLVCPECGHDLGPPPAAATV
jgi:hypothetical protein